MGESPFMRDGWAVLQPTLTAQPSRSWPASDVQASNIVELEMKTATVAAQLQGAGLRRRSTDLRADPGMLSGWQAGRLAEAATAADATCRDLAMFEPS